MITPSLKKGRRRSSCTPRMKSFITKIQTADTMDSDITKAEKRLKSFLIQLERESGIFYRIVYKNKNQHRRCSYFQYLLKVRRDLRLLQSANLGEFLNYSFTVIHGSKPSRKIHLLESLKKRRWDSGKNNFVERLLGIARLLSQMVEPMLNAARDISTLLARSFFMAFSLTVLALLARLRVLVQQMLLDVVLVLNAVSSVSQKAQAVKITHEGFEVFREYFPRNEYALSLDCVWKADKFVLVEKVGQCDNQNEDREDILMPSPAIQYRSVEALLGEFDSSQMDPNPSEALAGQHNPSVAPVADNNDGKQVEIGSSIEDRLPKGSNIFHSSSPHLNPAKRKRESSSEVAFISVKNPTILTKAVGNIPTKENESPSGDNCDPFFKLLTRGIHESSLF